MVVCTGVDQGRLYKTVFPITINEVFDPTKKICASFLSMMLLLAIEIAVVDFCDWKHRFDINRCVTQHGNH